MFTLPLLATLEKMLNAAIAMDPDARNALARHGGTILEIDIQYPSLRFFITPTPEGVMLRGHFDGTPDAKLRASSFGLLRSAFSRAELEGVFSKDVQIEGDVSLAGSVVRALKGLDPDWPEWLADKIGDVAANQVEQSLSSGKQFLKRTSQTRLIEWADFLQFEANTVVSAEELAEFADETDRLRADLERLEARLQRLDKAGKEAR